MRRPWLRDLPLLLGIAASAGVMASSTLATGPPPPLPRAALAAAQNATLRGNTATPEPASTDPEPVEAAKPARRKTPGSAGVKANDLQVAGPPTPSGS